MAHFKTTFLSDAIKGIMNVIVVVPQKKQIRTIDKPGLQLGSFEKEYPLLLLLHDEASSPMELCTYTNVERYATEHAVMVVIPEGHLSFYSDYATRDKSGNATGGSNNFIEANFTELKYETYILETLRYAQDAFPGTYDPQQIFVAGIGMGGFGAMKFAMKYPEQFAEAATISGYVDLQWLMDAKHERKEQFHAIFGGLKATGENDLADACMRLARESKQAVPRIIQIWSQEGYSSEMNRRFAEAISDTYPAYEAHVLDTDLGWTQIDQSLAFLLERIGSQTIQRETGDCVIKIGGEKNE